MNLSKCVKITRHNVAAAGATSDIEPSTGIDMQGFEGVLFLVEFGSITSGATTSIKAQQDTVSAMSSAADLAGTAVAVSDSSDNKVFWLDVYKPLERYVRCVVDRGDQNAVVDGIIAIQYGASVKPTTHDTATVGGGECHASPAEGTA